MKTSLVLLMLAAAGCSPGTGTYFCQTPMGVIKVEEKDVSRSPFWITLKVGDVVLGAHPIACFYMRQK